MSFSFKRISENTSCYDYADLGSRPSFSDNATTFITEFHFINNGTKVSYTFSESFTNKSLFDLEVRGIDKTDRIIKTILELESLEYYAPEPTKTGTLATKKINNKKILLDCISEAEEWGIKLCAGDTYQDILRKINDCKEFVKKNYKGAVK